MKLFGQLTRTLVNTALLPVAAAKDLATLGGTITEQDASYTEQALQRLKDEAAEEPEGEA